MARKIFLGLNNTAGICTRFKEGFAQNGIEADFYSYKEHIFGYKTDKIIKYSSSRFIARLQKAWLILKLLLNYKYFIFDTASTLLPDYKDVKIFRFFGKKTMMIFTGCDIRMPEIVSQFKWNPCRDCDDDYKKYVGCVIETKKQMIRKAEENFDFITAPMEASGYLEREFVRAYFPVNVDIFPPAEYVKTTLNKKLRLLHAPSNKVYKGTKYIIEAIERLKKDYDFEFIQVTNISITGLYNEIKKSDLIIDQMLTGIYGLFTIESMAMFRPVVCYVRHDSWQYISKECPIYNTDADGLYAALKQILDNPEQLIDAGNRSREFAEKFHSAKVITKSLYDILNGSRTQIHNDKIS